MGTVTSRDGTRIVFDRIGTGPALILVDGALCHRGSGSASTLANALSSRFTVFTYDRRGRGDSGDSLPPSAAGEADRSLTGGTDHAADGSADRELEDLDALIAEAGGSAYVYGHSSGAALALTAAASGLTITKLALYEPPYVPPDTSPQHWLDYRRQLNELLSAGRRGDAVILFMTLIGIPDGVIQGMRQTPAWPTLQAIAPTLAYDAALLGDGPVPHELAAKVGVPTMIMAGQASPHLLRAPAQAVAHAIPGARWRLLPDQTHDVKPATLAPILTDFFDILDYRDRTRRDRRQTLDQMAAEAEAEADGLYTATATPKQTR